MREKIQILVDTWPIMPQSIWSFNTTPIPHGNPWFFTQKAFPGGKKFEYCLGGVGIWTRRVKSFQRNTYVLIIGQD